MRNGLVELLQHYTIPLRKGDAITRKSTGNIDVTEVYMMDSDLREEDKPDEWTEFDLHFIRVAVNKVLFEAERSAFIGFVEEINEQIDLSRGPSYIELGGVLGDQGLALQFIAAGAGLGLWKVFTPKELGIEGPRADELAGIGYVMMTPWLKDDTYA